MVCALMEPMHEDYDLRQEQYNKQSLLSSERFLDGLLDMWTTHVVRRTFIDFIKAKFAQEGIFFCTPIICLISFINKRVRNRKN